MANVFLEAVRKIQTEGIHFSFIVADAKVVYAGLQAPILCKNMERFNAKYQELLGKYPDAMMAILDHVYEKLNVETYEDFIVKFQEEINKKEF